MLSDQYNLITVKASGLGFSLFDVASAREVPFGILQYMQCILQGTHPALPIHLPAPDLEAADNSKQDEHEETDEEQEDEREDLSDLEFSEDECFNLN